MPYVRWLLTKLIEEVNYESDDALEILDILSYCAKAEKQRKFVLALYKLWKDVPRTQNVKRFIIGTLSLEFSTDLNKGNELQMLEFFLLMDLFQNWLNNK